MNKGTPYIILVGCIVLALTLLSIPARGAKGKEGRSYTSYRRGDSVKQEDTMAKITARKADSLPVKAIEGDSSARQTAPKDSLLKETVAKDSTGSSAKEKKDSVAAGKAVSTRKKRGPRPQSAPSDTTEQSEETFTAPIEFEASDSTIVFPKKNMARLYGNAQVKYTEQELTGDYIRMLMDSASVYATYRDVPDSVKANTEINYPKFKDGEQNYEAKTMNYNFRSKKGYTTDIVTQQGEGFIIAKKTKKREDGSMFMQGAEYTTCDNHDHPHFYVSITNSKVRPQKNLISGPLYLVIADVPLPLFLPFGFFPFSKSYASGIIMPSPGEDSELGFYMRNGGYYWAINDYVDLQVTGDIYSLGSWAVNAQSNYAKRYRYSGSFDASYLNTVRGDKLSGDYNKINNFRISWQHRQDAKANPYRTLSANVNFSTSTYNHNNLDALYNQARMGENTKSSSISFTQRFPNSPITISGSMDIAQRSQDSTISLTLPNISISMSRIYPFKRKKPIGKERWYEKIQLSYDGRIRNSITTKENKLFQSSLVKDWNNSFEHSIPISASFDLFDYIKISPSFSYKERWFTRRIEKAFDPAKQRVVVSDTTYGFNRVYDFNTSISASTTIYGFWKPLPFLGKKLDMIRHRLEPSISFSWHPDFGDPFFGFWKPIRYQTPDGKQMEEFYSPFEGQGVPNRGKFGGISFNLSQNIEAKLRDSKDSTSFYKRSIIDNLSTGISYNMAADSLNWSDINASIALRFTNTIALRLGGSFETYLYDYEKNGDNIRPYKTNKLRILNGKGFGRFRGTSTSFSYNLNQDTFKSIADFFSGKKKDKDDGDKKGESGSSSSRESGMDSMGSGMGRGQEQDGSLKRSRSNDLGEYDSNGYLKSDMKWNLGFNYSISLGYSNEFDTRIKEYRYQLRHDLSLNGQFNPTKNWNFNFSANYNFELKKITNMSCNITRDLHCWSLTASFIPIGPYKSYNFTIQVKSSLLQDLKYKQSDTPKFNTAESWY
ncbi:putative LPS assembly protein LptD [Porphyromonas canoris]|uniref:putative LPS assembly protein LptD n=1 Tax=Porphyromonas canoris TaxID=36875 RepID=UPI0005664E7C|nr:putative LPS assembly protein LptD [Porphyromonas canoris]